MIKEEYKSQSDLKKEFCEKFKIDQDFKHIPYDIIQLEYERHVEYFINNSYDVYDFNYSPIKPLAYNKKGVKNNLLNVTMDPRTIDRFFTESGNSPIKFKTLDYLSVSLGYCGWKNFQKGKNREDVPDTIAPDLRTGSNTDIEKRSPPPHLIVTDIPGVIVINEDFFKNIEDKKQYTKTEFYTAKYNQNCVWWGILQGLDIQRKDHRHYIDIAKKSFSTPKYRKVEMIIHGLGGCGKSVLLKRLAYDIHSEPSIQHEILWLNNFKSFSHEGLEIIRSHPATNYLVFIEDWHRQSFTFSDIEAIAFFEKTNDIPNIRIILADRDTGGKVYRSYLNNINHLFLIGSEENENIIKGVVEKYPEWTSSSDKIFSQNKNYGSSLFLLLFIISRISEKEHQKISESFEPEAEFAHIVLSDMEYLSKLGYPGLSKALHYWACIYKESRISIAYETFLLIADHYNGNQKISRYFSHWNKKQDTVLNILKNYICINEDFETMGGTVHYGTYLAMKYRSNAPEMFHHMEFCHDVFADVGLSAISLEGVHPFDDTVIEEINDLILETADLFSMHQYFHFYWNKIKEYATMPKKTAYLKKLVQKTPRNLQRGLYQKLVSLRLGYDDLEDFFAFLRKEFLFFPAPLLSYVNASQSTDQKFKKQYELYLNVLTQKQLWKNFSASRLHRLLRKVDPEIVYIFYQNVMREKDFRSIPKEILIYVMDFDFRNRIPASLLVHSGVDDSTFMKSAFLRQKNNCAKRILEDSQWKSVDPELISKALYYADSYYKNQFLSHEFNLVNLPYFSDKAIAEAIPYSENKEVINHYLNKIENGYLADDLLFAVLSCFENAETLPAVVQKAIEKIIDEFRSQQSRQEDKYRKNRRFARLMHIGFHQHPVWKEASQWVLNQADDETDTDVYMYYIMDVLHGYRMFPELVEKECRQILEKSRNLGIQSHIVNPMRYKNLIIALSYPALRNMAHETAKTLWNGISSEAAMSMNLQSVEIFKNSHPQPKNYFLMDSDPYKIIKDIVDKRKIPEWDWKDWKNLSLQIRFF